MLDRMKRAALSLALKPTALALLVGLAPAVAPAAEDLIPLKLQTIGANASTFPDYYARAFGLYEKNGLDVEFLPPIYNAAGALQMVIQGAADVSYSGSSAALLADQQGRDIKIFGVVLEGYQVAVSLTESGMEKLQAAGVTMDSSFEDKIHALKGMTIASAATGSSTHMMMRYSLLKYGMDPEADVVIQPLKDFQTTVAALRQGVVDAVVGTASSINVPLESDGLATRLLSFEENDPLLRAYPTYGLMAQTDYLTENPEAARRLAMVFAESKAAIRRGITDEEIQKVHDEYLPDMAIETYKNALKVSFQLTQGPMAPAQINYDALVNTANAVAETPITVTYEQLINPTIAVAVDEEMGVTR